MFVKVEYTAKGIEACYNKSVSEAIEMATEKGKEIVGDKRYVACIERIKKDLHEYTNVSIQTKRSTCVSPVLIEAEQNINGAEKVVYHDMNCFMSEIINNYDSIETGDHKEFPDNFNDELIKVLGFGLDEKMFSTNIVKYPIKHSFSKRFTWYSASVNFEHVCFVVACILTRRVDIPPRYGERILYPFLYFIEKYKENKELLKFFMYFLMKLIRVYHTKSVDGARFFNPRIYMTNVDYGSYIDPNVEIYGNVRITNEQDDALSMFSEAPRSTSMAESSTIWFNWNRMTPIINKFTAEKRDIWNTIFSRSSKYEKFTNCLELFKFLTVKDILPRSSLAKHNYLNCYQRCICLNEDVEDAEFIETIKKVMVDCGAIHNKYHTDFNESKIGITYVGKNGIVLSKVLNITFGELMKNLMNGSQEFEDIILEPYIVQCYINSQNCVVRNEYNNTSEEFNDLLDKIQNKQETF